MEKKMFNFHFRRQPKKGQAIILIAIMMAMLLAMAALGVDAGMEMADRRDMQADVDAAALAGMPSYKTSTDGGHYVAMQYLANQLGFTLPIGSCVGFSSCPAGTYSPTAYSIVIADPSAGTMDLSITHTRPAGISAMLGFTFHSTAAAARIVVVGHLTIPAQFVAGSTGGDFMVNGGGVGNQSNITGPTYAFGSFGGDNAPHATQDTALITNFDGTTCPGNQTNSVSNGGSGNGLNYDWVGGTGTNPTNVPYVSNLFMDPPKVNTSVYTVVGAAKDASGNWKPGTYNGIYPSGGLADPGVYKIVNVNNTMNFGPLTNVITAPDGVEDPTGAVAIVVDGTDTGAMNLNGVKLNGLDDQGSPIPSPRDPQGTHNFVLFGAGPNPYTGTISVDVSDMSGLFYMPSSPAQSNGNSSFTFTGSFVVYSFTLKGGGNGSQAFHWICGLQAADYNVITGGLTR